ncbi:MAG: hypothetical protein OK439_03390 [Thaumarchaeota archaeon]|nr:hypothetical protein [Nitrososphaerota archaeon]
MQNPSVSASQSEVEANEDAFRAALNQQVAKAVLTGLGYFGAGQVVESLVYILELEHSVDMNSIATNIDGLRIALAKMFGGAAHVVETKIAEALGKQLGVDSEGKSIEVLIGILDSRISEFVPRQT